MPVISWPGSPFKGNPDSRMEDPKIDDAEWTAHISDKAKEVDSSSNIGSPAPFECVELSARHHCASTQDPLPPKVEPCF